MKLYHGSNHIIEKPIYGLGKRYNDYGLGFYCTESLEMAKEWGVSENNDGIANIYDLDTSNLSVLNLNDSRFSVLNWLSVLIQNRDFETSSVLSQEAKTYLINNFNVPYSTFDVIIGYRADDSYFSFAQDFLNGTISYRQLGNAMKLGKLGLQTVLKSEQAFSKIKFIDYELAPKGIYYSKKMLRDENARKDYFNLEKNRRQKDDLFIVQIIDEEIKPNDARLQ